MNTILHFLLLCQSCRSLRNVSFDGHILKSAYYGWLSTMTSSKFPLFSLASGPPKPKPTTGYKTSEALCVNFSLAPIPLMQNMTLESFLFSLRLDDPTENPTGFVNFIAPIASLSQQILCWACDDCFKHVQNRNGLKKERKRRKHFLVRASLFYTIKKDSKKSLQLVTESVWSAETVTTKYAINIS